MRIQIKLLEPWSYSFAHQSALQAHGFGGQTTILLQGIILRILSRRRCSCRAEDQRRKLSAKPCRPADYCRISREVMLTAALVFSAAWVMRRIFPAKCVSGTTASSKRRRTERVLCNHHLACIGLVRVRRPAQSRDLLVICRRTRQTHQTCTNHKLTWAVFRPIEVYARNEGSIQWRWITDHFYFSCLYIDP